MTTRAWRIFPFSARARVALLCLGFSLLISLPILLFVYRQTDSLFEERLRNGVDDRERRLMHRYDAAGVGGVAAAINDQIATGAASGGVVLLVDRDGYPLAGNIGAWPQGVTPPVKWTEITLDLGKPSQPVLFAVRAVRLPTGERLLLGANVEDREHMRASLVEALIGALLIALPLGLVGGILLLRVSERHAREIRRAASRIAAGDFGHRLDEQSEGEEFALLANAINAMLSRIEELVDQLRLVTDSLAHDLRSPLTRMRANIEKAAPFASAEPEQQALEAISTDIDRILRLISATLEIGRAEAGVGRQQFSTFRLDTLIGDICEIYSPIAEEQGVTIAVVSDSGVEYTGNRQLIGRSIANLIDNALKYASAGREIRIGVVESAEFVDLSVADRGPGIDESRREDAISKYRRLEEARTTEGSGLGLAMVRAVARLHDGDVTLMDNQPGLRVVIRLGRQASISGAFSGPAA